METLNALKVTLLNNYPNPHVSQFLRIDSYIPLSTTRTALLAFQQFVHQPCSCLADHFIYIDGTWTLEAHYGALCPHFDPIHLFIVDIYKGSNCSKNPATCKTGSLDSPFSRFHNWILQMLKVLLAGTLLAVLEVVSSVIACSQILQVIPKVKSYQMLSPQYGWFESLDHSWYTVTRLRSHAMITWPNSVAHHMKLWLPGSQSLQPKGCNCSMYSGPQIWSSRPLRTLLHLTIIGKYHPQNLTVLATPIFRVFLHPDHLVRCFPIFSLHRISFLLEAPLAFQVSCVLALQHCFAVELKLGTRSSAAPTLWLRTARCDPYQH